MFTAKKVMVGLGCLIILSMLMSACATPTPVTVVTTVEVVKTQTVVQVQTQEVVSTVEVVQTAAAPGAFTTPDPILSDLKVRQALAYCTNKLELIKSVYPLLTEDEQKALVMNTFIPTVQWAYAGDANITIYPFDATKGGQLLDEAGWKLNPDTGYRFNANGDELKLNFTTTNAAFRQTWSAVWENQMKACGILVVRGLVPASWWFGDSTGLARRDFQLGAYAWVGTADPGGQTLYACNQIPLPENGWNGQNYMGWCNQKASDAVILANNTLIKDDRKKAYTIVQQEFTKDVPSIPLFNRSEVYATAPDFQGFKVFAGDSYYTWNAYDWEIPGKDTIVLGFTQEPSSLFSWATSEQAAQQAIALLSGYTYTGQDYDYQPQFLKQLATIENGAAKNNDVDVKAGDEVYDASGNVITLTVGSKVKDSTGADVTYDGKSPLKMKQLVVTYDWISGLVFSDGKPLTKADMELAYKINCDRASGAVSYAVCDQMSKYDVTSDTSFTVTYRPGVQTPTYFLPPFGYPTGSWYPAHLVIQSEGAYKGKTLADVPAKDWKSLPEVAEKPVDVGPYMITDWKKGESLTFEKNPYYTIHPVKTPKIIISVITPENAEAQLLGGQVDVLDSTTLTAVDQTLKDAADKKQIQLLINASATWEHIDINLFLK